MKEFFSIVKSVLMSPKSLIISIIGVFIYTLGINLFLAPANLFPIGTMGLVYEISFASEKFIGINLSEDIVYFVVNIPILILGYYKVGKKFTIKTLFVVFFTSIFISIIPEVKLIDETLVAVIAGGIVSGIGVAISLRVGASTGGTDIVALYMSIAKGKSFGTFNNAFNGVIIAIAVILTQDLSTAVYLLIFIFIFSYVIDLIHNTTDKYTMIIITQDYEKIKKELYSFGMRRGMTVINSEGGYSGITNSTLLITCERNEYSQLSRIIKEADPKSFISTFKIQDVIGEFEYTYLKTL